ncbi:MAG TPA: transposase [Beijerinckiaceae bacterium]|nr:transposase [Beijerinckiaceae bacterium]
MSADAIRSEGEAYREFRRLRWPPAGEPVCPRCGTKRICELTTRPVFRCRACRRDFTVTTGTPFAYRKVGFADIMAALAAGPVPPSALSQAIGVNYKTAGILRERVAQVAAVGFPAAEHETWRARSRRRAQAPSSPPRPSQPHACPDV